ncbi:hypothetical protein QBC40DRAFT_260209 [Triangularia verruculosa]|uniref:Uncharacterized protein n=1 Tax=Triangularia verruculosa TaxID=2587418 RepID=A0AAN7AMI5_9PEZI|nr:hypothetical protein QBC40DRAFT_260209 [Triangularia verruculosa]
MPALQAVHSGVLSPDGQLNALESCVECKRTDLKVWTCVQCGHFTFCNDCWDKERPHKPGGTGIDNRPHEKADPAVVERLERIFGKGRTEEEQAELFDTDADTMWFGVNKNTNGSFLDHSNRLIEIMLEGENHDYRTSDRFPQLISFVGKTGEGVSTIIKMLIGRAQAGLGGPISFPAPVNGLTTDLIPNSGDVHLYADPATHHETHPLIFADCEGLGGGESAPRGKEYQDNSKRARRTIQRRLHWAKDSQTSSREFVVKRLFPRILYTFSDVVVFVIREARPFQSDVLVDLVEWAYCSIENVVNQPVLPHLIIALNRTDNAINKQQWDPEFATDMLLGAHQDITHTPELINIVQNLRRSGRIVKSAKEFLECFYRSITVVRIPTKGRYMQIDNQIGKLYAAIRDRGTNSHTEKKSVRMALNAERLHQFMNAAYEHFSADLDQPFNFAKEALQLNPMPHDFQGHILHLILAATFGLHM